MRESRMADEYERLAEKTELSYEEALALKEEIRKRGQIGEIGADVHHSAGWHVVTRMSNFDAVNFLNAPPRTLPGEANLTTRPDGTVDIYWFGPSQRTPGP
jgi:hypothetical protein